MVTDGTAEKEIWEDLHKKNYARFSNFNNIAHDFGDYFKLLNTNMTALDIGCGIGNSTRFLAGYVGEVWGIDISEEVIKKAKAQNASAHFVAGNGKDLSNFEDNKFDFIFSYSVFIHIPREFQKHYFKECERVLKKGGYALIQVSSEPDLDKLEAPSMKTSYGSEPHITWDIDDMEDFIKNELRLELMSIKRIKSCSPNLKNYYVLLHKL